MKSLIVLVSFFSFANSLYACGLGTRPKRLTLSADPFNGTIHKDPAAFHFDINKCENFNERFIAIALGPDLITEDGKRVNSYNGKIEAVDCEIKNSNIKKSWSGNRKEQEYIKKSTFLRKCVEMVVESNTYQNLSYPFPQKFCDFKRFLPEKF